MKKIIFSILFLNSLVSFSQMTLKKLDGTVLNDGDVVTFNVATDPESYFGFVIGNSSTNDITVKAKCMAITNATGGNLQFCVQPVCVANLVVGNYYPSAGATIPAGGNNGNFDHLINTDTGINPNSNVEYVMKFTETDHSGNETGTPITIKYRYVPTASTSAFTQLENAGIILKSNNVSSTLDIQSTKKVALEIYDTTGKLVQNNFLISGSNSVDVSSLATGAYIANIVTEENQKYSMKIVKR